MLRFHSFKLWVQRAWASVRDGNPRRHGVRLGVRCLRRITLSSRRLGWGTAEPCESQNLQSPNSSGKLIDMRHITVITLITVTCDALSYLLLVTLTEHVFRLPWNSQHYVGGSGDVNLNQRLTSKKVGMHFQSAWHMHTPNSSCS